MYTNANEGGSYKNLAKYKTVIKNIMKSLKTINMPTKLNQYWFSFLVHGT